MKISKKDNNVTLNLLLFYENEDIINLAESLSEKFCKNPSKNSRKVRLTADLILLLISNGLRCYPHRFKISMSSGLTFRGHYYCYSVLSKTIKFLVEKNIILYKKGYYFKGNIQSSLIGLTPYFMESYKEPLSTAKQNKNTRRVFIRDKNKEDVFESYSETTFMSQVFLNKYEDFLIRSNVLLDKLPLTVSPIHRIFNGDEEHGGRIYSKWSFLPKKTREKITIGGERLAEIDLKACTLSIACHLNGIEVPGDLYSFGVKRDVAKKCMIIMFYSQTEIRAKRAIARLGADNGFEKGELFKKCLQHLDKNNIRELMMSGKGLSYIKKESDFCISVIEACIEHNVVILSIHDAFLCRKKDLVKLKALIDFVYLKHFGGIPNCHITS